MTRVQFVAIMAAVCVLSVPAVGQEKAKKDDFRKAVQQWVGVSKDMKQRDVVKGSEPITDAATFEKVWKAWQPKAELPKVDFTTHFVTVVTSSYEPEYLSIYGGPKWYQSSSNKSPTMLKQGFGWGIGVFERKGVEELNGKKLPAPAKGK